MFFSEYLFVHVKPAMQVNQWLNRKLFIAPPPPPFPELEKDTSLIGSMQKERDKSSMLKKTMKLSGSFFESYEYLLIFLYIIFFLRVKTFRLNLRYEEMLLLLFITSLLFIAFLTLKPRVRYLYHLIYLFCPLYASLIVFLARRVRLWKPHLFIPALAILFCPLCYKGISYNIKSVKENTLSNSYHRVVGDWIKNNYGTAKILVAGDKRYALFSGNYSFLSLVNNREELLKRARMVGASILVMDEHDMKDFPTLKPMFTGDERQIVPIYNSFFEDIGQVKIFKIDTTEKTKIVRHI